MATEISHIESQGGVHVIKVKSEQLGKLMNGKFGHVTITFSALNGVCLSVTDESLEDAGLSMDKSMSFDEFVGRLVYGTYDPEPKDPPGTLGYV